MLAQQVKDLKCDAGVMLKPDQGDPCNAGILRHAGDVCLFHFCDLLDFGAGFSFQTGENLQIHPELLCQFHAAVMEHACALRRQFQHFIVCDLVQFSGVGDDAGIRGVHAVHIRIDLAQIRPESRCQCHGPGVAAAAAQRGDVPQTVHALKTCHQNDAVLIQFRPNPFSVDLLDSGIGMYLGGLDAHLPRRQRHTGQAHGLQCHGAQGNRDLLAGGQQHIHLPLGRLRVDLLRLGNEIVRRVPLGGQDYDDVIAL